jgi:hypothetical protein
LNSPFYVSRFKRLALLDTQGLELLVALHPRVWWARRMDLCDARHCWQRGSAGGQMQKLSAGKFHF